MKGMGGEEAIRHQLQLPAPPNQATYVNPPTCSTINPSHPLPLATVWKDRCRASKNMNAKASVFRRRRDGTNGYYTAWDLSF